jgi:hypothetical protein
MARIYIVTTIAAPVEVCFDLSRDIDFHIRTQHMSGERSVAGRTSGLIGLGESVTGRRGTWASASGSRPKSVRSTGRPPSAM